MTRVGNRASGAFARFAAHLGWPGVVYAIYHPSSGASDPTGWARLRVLQAIISRPSADRTAVEEANRLLSLQLDWSPPDVPPAHVPLFTP